MTDIKAVGVYCSASDEVGMVYKEAAKEVGHRLAEAGITLVYGGSVQGLMGVVANAAVEKGGRVLGYSPIILNRFEQPNFNITELHFVDTMHTRKQLMFKNSNAFFVLPGGFGTLDETFEIIVFRQLELHMKPIVFLNINNYWAPLEKMIDNIFHQNFAHSYQRRFFHFANSINEAFDYLFKTGSDTKEISSPGT